MSIESLQGAPSARGTNASGTAPLAVQMRNVHMQFGGVTALAGVDFEVREGEVHAWCGENGAGKSTAARVLAGALAPVAGSVEVFGATIDPRPASAIRAGVRMITQEISLFPPLTVAENLVTGGAGHPKRLVNWKSIHRRSEEYLRLIGLDVDPAAPLAGLTIGEQQLVEIARAMFSGGRVVILDEPTSALGTAEAARLFNFVQRMASGGTSFVLITHFLDDVMQHAQRATVLRNGRVVGTLKTADSDKADLVRLMVGHDDLLAEAASGQDFAMATVPAGEPRLRLDGVAAAPTVRDVTLQVHPGEVVGVFGDLASGCMELGDLVLGLCQASRGSVTVDGVSPRSPEHAVRTLGVGYIPADRRSALALHKSATTNVTVAQLHKFFGPRVSARTERDLAAAQLKTLSVKSCTPTTAPATLSGGNQQKLLFARWLISPPNVLVLVEPTRGMDLKAKADVVDLVHRAARESGAAVLVISAEPETILSMANRVYVTQQGRVVADLSGRQASAQTLMAAAHGHDTGTKEGVA